MSDAEDTLRQWIIDHSPEIRHDVNLMADMIRELVTLEREKLNLDNPRGTIELWPNEDKKSATDPELIGNGRIAGRSYRAAAWISKTDRFRIVLLPPQRK